MLGVQPAVIAGPVDLSPMVDGPLRLLLVFVGLVVAVAIVAGLFLAATTIGITLLRRPKPNADDDLEDGDDPAA